MPSTPSRFRVGSFLLDVSSGELRPLASDSPADKILLREQPFQILRMLVEREGKIVTREEIRNRLWPNDTIVDFDHSINVAIGVLRRALGDSAGNPRYIETLARRGYRLIAAVERLESVAAAGGDAVSDDTVETRTPPLGDLTGQTISHYRVLEVLGGGGMGLVYEAEDLRLGRRAALKFLPYELASDPTALQRLEREAQTASALNHPNICTIYDIDDYEGQRFIAMELLEGETLQHRLATSAPEPIPAVELLDIAIQICVGLEAAHGKDIVHRDIKPANIFLTTQGTVKLLDFGVAKVVSTEEFVLAVADDPQTAPRAPHHVLQSSLTRTGATVGTTGYMSPEQLRREKLDARSDLFSLGLVLYEMATGRRAFTGNTSIAVEAGILHGTLPAVDAVNTAVPRTFGTVVAKALEKERSRRYQRAADLRHDLERTRDELQRSGARRVRRWLPAAVAVLALAAAAIWISSRRTRDVTLAANDTVVLAHLTNATGDRVYDDAVYTALRIGLEQTPYLNVLADDKLRGHLTALDLDPGARVTPEVALQLCRRTGSKLVAAPAIAETGNRLALELKATDCESGSTVGRIEKEAASRDDVVAALGGAAVEFRRQLGEPRSSIVRYNAPLERATSASPDALELLRLGYRRQLAGDMLGAIPFHQRAAQIDPSFALAHAALSVAHSTIGEMALSAASARTALALRDRMTAPTRFQVESTYHLMVTGDREQASAVLSQWVQAFPHDFVARNNFGRCLTELGELDRAAAQFREAARLLPSAYTYTAWLTGALFADRLDEAEKVSKEALDRGFDSPGLRDLEARLAFHRKDDAAMQRQWAWAEGRADAHAVVLGKARVEAYHGRMRDALRSEETATALAIENASPEAYSLAIARWRVDVGLSPARPIVVAPFQTMDQLSGALLLARAGQLEEARRMADVLRRDFPTHTIVQKYGLPVIEAAVALASNDASGAVAMLEPVAKYELAVTDYIEVLYPAYLRGLAELKVGAPDRAASEFQKVLDRPALVGRSILIPLATLQLARAQRAMGADSTALGSYETFLEIWKDADADIPLYAEATAEHRELRARLGSSVSSR